MQGIVFPLAALNFQGSERALPHVAWQPPRMRHGPNIIYNGQVTTHTVTALFHAQGLSTEVSNACGHA